MCSFLSVFLFCKIGQCNDQPGQCNCPQQWSHYSCWRNFIRLYYPQLCRNYTVITGRNMIHWAQGDTLTYTCYCYMGGERGVKKFDFFFFYLFIFFFLRWGGDNSNYFGGYVNLRGYFLDNSNLVGIFRSLQNIAFCKVFCDVFTKNVAFYYFCKQTPCVS